MSKPYKAAEDRPALHWPDGSAEPGETFDANFTAEEEAEHLASGRLELVPLTYRNIGSFPVADAKPGDTFDYAYTVTQEQALLGVHIERVEQTKKRASAGSGRKGGDSA